MAKSEIAKYEVRAAMWELTYSGKPRWGARLLEPMLHKSNLALLLFALRGWAEV
jgi:hypothetical protein